MKKFLPLSILISLVFILSSCSGGAEFSEATYQSSEVGVAKRVIRCRVLAVREVQILDQDAKESGQLVGVIAGGVLGSALGGTIGGDRNDQALGSAVGTVVGAIGGGLAGEAVGEARSGRVGLEYSILTTDGEEMTFAQDRLSGDRIINAGETCRLQVSGRINRVLPAEYLPETIEAPKTTTFE